MLKPLYHRAASEPWLAHEPGLVPFLSRISYDVPLNANRKTQLDNGDVEDGYGTKLLSSQMWGDVGVISVNGVMIAGAGLIENLAGGIADSQIENAITTMAAKNPSGIVMDWNTPGGTALGGSELAQVVADVSKRCLVVSYCGSGYCASKGMWAASAASGGFYATSSSMIGSIGCVAQFVILARLLSTFGIDVVTKTSSPLKASGNSMKEMTTDESSYLQSVVDEIGNEFKSAVQRNRPGVDESAFDGRVFSTKQAQSLGLIDGQVSSLAALVGKIQSGEVKNPYSKSGQTGSKSTRTQFNFKPVAALPGKTIIHSAASLAKVLGATPAEVSALISTGKLTPLKTEGDRFMFSVSDINKLSSKQNH